MIAAFKLFSFSCISVWSNLLSHILHYVYMAAFQEYLVHPKLQGVSGSPRSKTWRTPAASWANSKLFCWSINFWVAPSIFPGPPRMPWAFWCIWKGRLRVHSVLTHLPSFQLPNWASRQLNLCMYHATVRQWCVYGMGKLKCDLFGDVLPFQYHLQLQAKVPRMFSWRLSAL